MGGWCLPEPKSPLLAHQTAGAARFKSLAAGTFFLPQQEPEAFMFFNTIHQLGSCLPVSRKLPSPFLSPPHHLRLIHSDLTSNTWGCHTAACSQTKEATACHCNALLLAFFFNVPTASSPSPEQDSARPSSKNPLTWTVDDVVWFVKDADPHALGPHVELFRKHVCKRLPLVFLGNLSQVHRQSQEIASMSHTDSLLLAAIGSACAQPG